MRTWLSSWNRAIHTYIVICTQFRCIMLCVPAESIPMHQRTHIMLVLFDYDGICANAGCYMLVQPHQASRFENMRVGCSNSLCVLCSLRMRRRVVLQRCLRKLPSPL